MTSSLVNSASKHCLLHEPLAKSLMGLCHILQHSVIVRRILQFINLSIDLFLRCKSTVKIAIYFPIVFTGLLDHEIPLILSRL